MLNPLNAPTVAAAAPLRKSAAPAKDEAACADFTQALEHAATQPPKVTARERLRGGAIKPKAEPQPEPTPAIAGGKNAQTLPPRAEGEDAGADADADGAPTPQGVAALLAQLRAAAPPASTSTSTSTSTSVPADAAGKAASTAMPTVQSDSAKRASNGSAHGAAVGTGSVTSDQGHGAGVAAGLAATLTTSGRTADEGGTRESGRDSFAQHLGAAAPQSAVASHSDTPFTLPTLLSAAAASAAGAAAVAVQADVQLAATPGSADFGPQLGAQISTFVRDGIEHARLHLNPAEMGPVSVQIQLEGQTALVHLSAENPHTRQALEQAMPLLAGSLREAGLTLAGGGVFEQPRQGGGARAQGDAEAGAGGQPGRSDEAPLADASPPASPLATRRRGVVDLVA